MFAFLESAVGDLAQQAGVVVQAADMAPIDLVRVGIEMVRAEGCQALEHCVDLDLRDEECIEGFGIVGGAADGHGGAPRGRLHRFPVTIIILMGSLP